MCVKKSDLKLPPGKWPLGGTARFMCQGHVRGMEEDVNAQLRWTEAFLQVSLPPAVRLRAAARRAIAVEPTCVTIAEHRSARDLGTGCPMAGVARRAQRCAEDSCFRVCPALDPAVAPGGGVLLVGICLDWR